MTTVEKRGNGGGEANRGRKESTLARGALPGLWWRGRRAHSDLLASNVGGGCDGESGTPRVADATAKVEVARTAAVTVSSTPIVRDEERRDS